MKSRRYRRTNWTRRTMPSPRMSETGRTGLVAAEQVCGDRGYVFMYSSGRSTAGESVWARGSRLPPCGWQRCRGRVGCKQGMRGGRAEGVKERAGKEGGNECKQEAARVEDSGARWARGGGSEEALRRECQDCGRLKGN